MHKEFQWEAIVSCSASHPKKGGCHFLKHFILKSSFSFSAKLSRNYREFPHDPCLKQPPLCQRPPEVCVHSGWATLTDPHTQRLQLMWGSLWCWTSVGLDTDRGTSGHHCGMVQAAPAQLTCICSCVQVFTGLWSPGRSAVDISRWPWLPFPLYNWTVAFSSCLC